MSYESIELIEFMQPCFVVAERGATLHRHAGAENKDRGRGEMNRDVADGKDMFAIIKRRRALRIGLVRRETVR